MSESWTRIAISDVAASPFRCNDDAESRLIPILKRALECGRGPRPLVKWVEQRVQSPSSFDDQPRLAQRLARELADRIRRGGAAETQLFALGDTILATADDATSESRGRPFR